MFIKDWLAEYYANFQKDVPQFKTNNLVSVRFFFVLVYNLTQAHANFQDPTAQGCYM